MRHPRIAQFTISALCLAAALLTAEAAFKDSGWGVRPLGMGGAFTAIGNDANAPLFNPAGVAQISQEEVTFMSSKLFTGLEGVDIGLNYLGYLHPLSEKAGNIAFSWASLSAPTLYSENSYTLSYARLMGCAGNCNFAAGGNVKFLSHEYTLDSRTFNDPVFAHGSEKGAVTGDLGVLLTWPTSGVSLGLASKNITSPDVGLKTDDPVSNENVLGFAYYQEQLPYLQLPYFTAAFDVVSRAQALDVRVGLETWVLNGSFALRAGANPEAYTFGLGYEIPVFSDSKLVIDYALAWPVQVEQTTGSHRFGLTLRLP